MPPPDALADTLTDDALRAAVAAATGHVMTDLALLRRACTHSSMFDPRVPAAERLAGANERLEFLGDSLLGAALAEWLHAHFPTADEGRLSRLKGQLASREALASAWERSGLVGASVVGAHMGLPARWPTSIKANVVEGILGAVFIDGGWDALTTAVRKLLADELAAPDVGTIDPRMRLQEWCLAHHQRLPEYTWARSGGTDHAPEFSATVAIDTHRASGTGTSRRRAEAAAAQALLAVVAAR